MIRVTIASWLMALIPLAACNVDSAEEWHTKWGGPYDVYVLVFAETDCSNLEAMIVAQVARVDQSRTAQEAVAAASIIQATYRRMVDLSCPEAFREAGAHYGPPWKAAPGS